MLRQLIRAALLSSALLGLAQAQDDEESHTRQQLQQLKIQMTQLGQDLRSDKRQRSGLLEALRQSEVALGEIQRGIVTTRKDLQWSRRQLGELRQQRHELAVARGEQQELISRAVQTAYQMGRQSQLKILLNQQQPDTLARAMAYYDYFYQARNDAIEAYLEIMARIDILEPEIAQSAAQLGTTEAMLDTQLTQLAATQAQRQHDLLALNNSIRSKDDHLKKLNQDREDLEKLLLAIEQAVANIEIPKDFQPFAAAKGNMPWPLAGKPSNRFGRRRGEGSLRWQGLMIPAEEGSTVRAIHHGRVVFADWFRGSGLLVILDHGNGYMSLYAHNQSLLRDVGEWVTAGAPLSTVGNSGGQLQAALYFEIRHNNKPSNPQRWCSKNSG